MFRLLAERDSEHELSALLGEARRLVTSTGDPHLASYLHESVALREAQTGRVNEARRHLSIAGSLLGRHPNAWIQQLMHMSAACVASLECDFPKALSEIGAARKLGAITGPSYRDPIIDSNESHFELWTGKLGSALRTFRRLSSHRQVVVQIGALDGIARLFLCLNHIPDCEASLQALVGHYNTYSNFFSHRWVACTRIGLLLRQGHSSRAVDASVSEVDQARRISDTPHTIALLLLRAKALAQLGRQAESGLALLEASETGAMSCRDQQGHYHEACYQVLEADGAKFGRLLRERALRIWRAEGNVSAQLAFLSLGSSGLPLRNYSQSIVDKLLAATPGSNAQPTDVEPGPAIVSAIAAALDLAAAPELAATELMNVAAAVGCASRVQRYQGESSTRDKERTSPDPLLAPGEVPGNALESVLVADILRIGKAVRTLARAREEERKRAALWPAEDLPEGDGLFLSDEMLTLATIARKVAPTNVPVLITGETGTGKEILARAIHAASTRAKATFLPFNCSAGPRDMIDGQLFGHRRGAFTGATEHAPGVVRAAAGGTLFLDEIGESPLEVQPKLLRFLESGEIHPLGESLPMKIDVRVIAATNVDLDAAVANGRFREDLFYRLNIVRLALPPLRERRVEIPVFAQHYLQKHARELDKGDLRLAEETMEYLLLYRWPGNVRQLANEMRRLAALAETNAVLMPEHLSREIVASRRTVPAAERTLDSNEVVVRLDQPFAAAAEHLERAILPYALRQSGGRVEEAAKRLGLSRKGLYLKRLRLGLELPEPHSKTA